MIATPNGFDVTTSIVIYKTDPADLTQAIRCCLDTSLRMEIVVVDNFPTEESRHLCRSLGVRYIGSERNVGFGAAHNLAIAGSSSSKFHLVLNPDVQFDGDVLLELFALLEMNNSIGLAMPRVLYPDGSSQNLCKRLPSPADIFSKRFLSGLPLKMVQERIAFFELRSLAMDSILSVPFLSGCFMFLRKQALKEVGSFDERFFMYFEDLDLTRRIRQRYDTVYYPRQHIIHRHEMGSYKSVQLLLRGLHSAVTYFNKWGWVYDRDRKAVNDTIRPLENLRLPLRHIAEPRMFLMNPS